MTCSRCSSVLPQVSHLVWPAAGALTYIHTLYTGESERLCWTSVLVDRALSSTGECARLCCTSVSVARTLSSTGERTRLCCTSVSVARALSSPAAAVHWCITWQEVSTCITRQYVSTSMMLPRCSDPVQRYMFKVLRLSIVMQSQLLRVRIFKTAFF